MPYSYGILGTYPPTRCGVANFSRALLRSLASPDSGDRVGVVRVLDAAVASPVPEVVGHLHALSRAGAPAAAALLNTFDVAIIQYDHRIYGGRDGDQLLAVLDRLRVPAVVVMHTVLTEPTPHQAEVLTSVAAASDAVVALTDAARQCLINGYGVDPARVRVIRHGTVPPAAGDQVPPQRRPLIVTWGLLGPGKGIEWGIDGLQGLRALRPVPAYIVAGRTHPRVYLQQGDSYRLGLDQRARAVGVGHLFRSVGSYLDDAALVQLIRRADVVLLPYDSPGETSSPVLAEAVAAGKPVVATAFPHAVELLGAGAGLLVPHGDSTALGAAVHRVLTEPGLADGLAAAARRVPAVSWPAVAARYRALAAAVIRTGRRSDTSDRRRAVPC